MCACLVVSDSVATPWTVACEAPLPMEFSRKEYWNGLSFLIPGDLPDPGIRPASPVFPALQADSLLLSHLGSIYSEYIMRNAGLDNLQTGIRLPVEIQKTSDMHMIPF